MWPGGDDVYPETAEPHSHAHDYDETLGFFGTDPADLYDLGGEIEFWIEDEKFMLTRSCLIFIPQGHLSLPTGDPQGRSAHLPLLGRTRRGLRAGDGRQMSAGGSEGLQPGAPMSRPVADLGNPMDVTGLNVIVTGGASGIGSGIARPSHSAARTWLCWTSTQLAAKRPRMRSLRSAYGTSSSNAISPIGVLSERRWNPSLTPSATSTCW